MSEERLDALVLLQSQLQQLASTISAMIAIMCAALPSNVYNVTKR